MNGRLLGALASRNPVQVREAERVFLPLVEGFQGAVAQLQIPGRAEPVMR